MSQDRLKQQINFIIELDKLKTIVRTSYLTDASRRENSAEHSWHVTMMALLLSEHCPEKLDSFRIVRMLLVHDIVEIDAGDTCIYDTIAARDKSEREMKAATRIFGLLPADQTADFQELWLEFESRRTPEAKFAAALDRLMPLLHSYCTQGEHWKEDRIVLSQVMKINRTICHGSPKLWDFARSIIEECVAEGYLSEG